MGPLGFSLSVTYSQLTSKTHKIMRVRTMSIIPVIMMIFLLPCCLSLPRFFSSKDQARHCAVSFFRCCSDHSKIIPYRCFELNQCPLNFFPLERYNEICSNIYEDSMEEIDSNSQKKMMMIMEEVIKNDMEEVIKNDIEEVIKNVTK